MAAARYEAVARRDEDRPHFPPSPSGASLMSALGRTVRGKVGVLLSLAATTAVMAALLFSPMPTLSLPQVRHKPDYPKLHLVLPLDERSHGPRSCKTLLAAVMSGYEPVIVNWDLVASVNDLYSAKIPGVYNYIASLGKRQDNEIVLMADAYDLWLQLPPRALIRRFRELNAKIVIGADFLCWPNDPKSAECQAAPESPVPDGVFGNELKPRWANSGDVIGTAKDMRAFYKRLVDALKARPHENDQTFFNEMLPEGEMVIDYWYRMFWTTAGPGEGTVIPVRHPVDGDVDDKIIPYDLVPPLCYHTLTGELPVALHFNKDATKGTYMEGDFFNQLWWTKTDDKRFNPIIVERLAAAKIFFAHDGSSRPYHDVCPQSILSRFAGSAHEWR